MKLSAIEKILIVATIILLFLGGSSKTKSPPVQVQPQEQPKPQIKKEIQAIPQVTVAEAELELQILSRYLDVRYDDMQEVTFYSCRNAGRSPLYFIPYVSVNQQFKPRLFLQIFSSSNYPLFFDTLYIKTANKVYNFGLGARKSSYNERMSWDIYKSLKEAVDSGYLKFRIAGNDMGEREMTIGEIEGIEAVFSIYEYLSKVKVIN